MQFISPSASTSAPASISVSVSVSVSPLEELIDGSDPDSLAVLDWVCKACRRGSRFKLCTSGKCVTPSDRIRYEFD